MTTLNFKMQLLASVGFVCALATTGFGTHIQTVMPDAKASMITGAFQSAYEEGFVKANPLNDLAVTAFGAFKYAALNQGETGVVIGNDGWLFTSEEFEVSAYFYENLSLSAAEIARVYDLLAAQGITLIPVIVPDKADVYPEQLPTQRSFETETRRMYLRSLLGRLGVPALDATDALRDQKATREVFVKDDTHWSPQGSRAVAKLIAARQAETDLTLTAATVTTLQGSTINYDGDLLKFIPTGALRAYVGPAQNQIDTYSTTVESQAGLFGDAAIDVALVGTSFSAKPEWNFAGFLQEALGADVLNFATQGQGPFAPMHAFLASDTFQNSPPKLVVWEIPARYTSKEMTQ